MPPPKPFPPASPIATPPVTELPMMVQAVTVRMPVLALAMPPPDSVGPMEGPATVAPKRRPLATVSPVSVTL